MRGVNNIKTIFLDTCRDTRMFNEDINFKHKCIHKYTWYITSGVMTVKSLIDIVLVRKNMLKWVNDVKTVKGLRCLNEERLDRMIVLWKIRLFGSCVKIE